MGSKLRRAFKHGRISTIELPRLRHMWQNGVAKQQLKDEQGVSLNTKHPTNCSNKVLVQHNKLVEG